MKVVHSWLKDYLGEHLPPVEQVADVLTFHAFEIEEVVEVEGEMVIDVKVLPDRSSDCLSHRGIAREIATLTNTSLTNDPLTLPVAMAPTDAITVDIEDTEACPRFTAALITGIEVKESPAWLENRLRALGQRPINNIVDATNYVMYAIGQPLHAYDADLFPQTEGKWRFAVRFAREGEMVSLIPEGGKTEGRIVTCQGTELLVVDASTDTPIGLAGVKGGRCAGVHGGTKNIIIEAAHFHPTITRRTARRLGIVIDASKRFENEPSRELPPFAQRDIVKLITDIAGGTFDGMIDVYPEPQVRPPVTVRFAQVNALLGLALPQETITDIITRLGAVVTAADAETVTVSAPFERTDLNIEADYIEEVGRIHGLEHVEAVPPAPVPLAEMNMRQYYTERIRHTLLALGFSEVITSSFHTKGDIQLQNALASDKSFVRGNLTTNLTAALDANFAHVDLLGNTDVRVFEIGTVFERVDGTVGEHLALAVGVRQKGTGYTPKDDAVLSSVEGAVAEVLGTALAWQRGKGVSETNLSSILSTLPTPTAYEPFAPLHGVAYRTPSPYPAMSRDIALWTTAGTTPADVEAVLNEHAGELRVRTTLFDEFTKDGRTSYAFRLVFQSKEKTLTDGEVNAVMDGIYAAVQELGWEVR